MKITTQPQGESREASNGTRPPALFLIIVVLIAGLLVAFLILRPAPPGKGGRSSNPANQH